MMKSIPKWLERLSLDAVIVAVVWGIALSTSAGRTGVFHDMLILGLATWLTYVADRLWEVRPGKDVPETDRHLYYRRQYRKFKSLWLVIFAGTVLYAVAFLPGWKLLWGWGLVMAIVAYLYYLTRIYKASVRLLFKRISVPLIFSAGIALMSEAWSSLDSVAGLVVLLSAAVSNVLIISYQENRDRNMPDWLPSMAIKSVFALLVASHVALFIRWPVGVAGLVCFIGYFVLYIQLGARKLEHLRFWVDAILTIAGTLILVLG